MKTHILGLLINKCQKINLKENDYNILFNLDEQVLEYLVNETNLMDFNYLLKIALDFYQYSNIAKDEVITILEKCKRLFVTPVRNLVIYLMESEYFLSHEELIIPTLDLISHNLNETKVKAIIKVLNDDHIYELGMSLEVAKYVASLNEYLISDFEAIYNHQLSSNSLKKYLKIYQNCSTKDMAHYVYNAYVSKVAIKHHFNVSLADIISTSQSYLARYIYEIGSSTELYEVHLVEESIKVLQNAKASNAMPVSLLLTNKDLIKSGASLIKASILSLSQNEVETSLIYNLLKSSCITENISNILAMLILGYKVQENITLLKERYDKRTKALRLLTDITDFLKTLEADPIVFNWAFTSFNNILKPYFGLKLDESEFISKPKRLKQAFTYDEALMLEYQAIKDSNIEAATFGKMVRERKKKN